MAQCPICSTPGAYVGFSSVECRNPDCEHFVLHEEKICPCCGQVGHTPEDGNCPSGDGSLLDPSQQQPSSGDTDASHCA